MPHSEGVLDGRSGFRGCPGEEVLQEDLHQGCDRDWGNSLGGELCLAGHEPSRRRDLPDLDRASDHAERQRPAAQGRCAAARDAGDDAAVQAEPHGHQARLRSRRVRSLHGSDRRREPIRLLDPDAPGAWKVRRHH